MKRRKLNYRFLTPNPVVVTADCILKFFIKANAGKVEAAIQQAADTILASDETSGCCEGRPA